MTDVVLFHHIQGLTPGVTAFADALRTGGHTVLVPDLFEGRTFASIEEGFAYTGEVGDEAMEARVAAVVSGLPHAAVYAGMSWGVMIAQQLAQTREGALGALLLFSFAPPEAFGGPGAGWPAGLPAQIHAKDADPFFVGEGDIEPARTLVEERPEAELFLYPGDEHLFADSSLPAYDAEATALLTERSLAFLAGLQA